MKPLTLAITAMILGNGIGCVHLQPVGPMAKTLGVQEPTVTSRPAPGVKVTSPRDANTMPMLPPAPPPSPPAVLVTPGEVTESNRQDAARRLIDEMEADRKAMDSMPRYAEISIIGK